MKKEMRRGKSASTRAQKPKPPKAEVILLHRCPLCDSDRLEPIRTEKNQFPDHVSPLVKAFHSVWIQLLQCQECHFSFTKEIPSAPRFFQERYDIGFDPREEHESDFKDKLHEFLFDLLNRNGRKGGKLLDIGSFAGIFIRESTKRGYQAEGVELNPRMAEFCQDELGMKIHQGAFLNIRGLGRGYDLITMIDVLEHLLHPRQILERCYSLLKPGGHLLVKVPNLKPQVIKQEVANRLKISDLGVFQNYAHINHFSPDSLSWVLKDVGFEVNEIVATPSEDFPSDSIKNKVRNRFRGVVFQVMKTWQRATGMNIGLNIAAIAKKPEIKN